MASENGTAREPSRWALIIVGIPGDRAHGLEFRQTAETWRNWLIEALRVPPDQVVRLPPIAEPDQIPPSITAESIRQTLTELATKLQPDDSLWVFTLGHGNYDGRHAWLHVQGRDPSEEEFGRWFADIRCREQVFWLTQANSGWFVRPLSRPGRIVIAATAADDESNETEFAAALAELVRQQTGPPAAGSPTLGCNDRISVAELFQAVGREVQRRFDSDKRLRTEHAQLDDNGDGRGSETLAAEKKTLADTDSPPAASLPAHSGNADGELAHSTWIPWRKPSAAPLADKP
jgi:hypothetical protein